MVFTQAGLLGTEKTLEIGIHRARKENCFLVLASNTGETVKKALNQGANPKRLVCVTHMVGFREKGEDEFPKEERQALKNQGVEILTTTHVLAGVDRALRFQFGGISAPEIMAHTLRIFGQGTKVAVEIAIMAQDAGLIPYGVPLVAIGGSGRGADTALYMTSAHSTEIFAIQIHEVLAKPDKWN